MRKAGATASLVLLCCLAAAQAQARPDSTAMSCARAAALVRSSGALILGTGGQRFDRYVSDRRFCAPTEQTKIAFVPSADRAQCAVGYTCFEPFVDPSDTFH